MVIALCNIKIIYILVLVFLHVSQIRSTFLSGSRASPRVKIKKSLYLENVTLTELKVVFSQIVFKKLFVKRLREFDFCILHSYP